MSTSVQLLADLDHLVAENEYSLVIFQHAPCNIVQCKADDNPHILVNYREAGHLLSDEYVRVELKRITWL
jgi:hypothetical protein